MIDSLLRRRILERHLERIRALQESAGQSAIRPSRFLSLQVTFASIGLVSALGLVLLGLPGFLLLALPAIGFQAPLFRLHGSVRRRQSEIERALPHCLDLLTLALEAGLDLIAALEEIFRRDRPHPLREEFLLTLKGIRMGCPRVEAFQRLARRTGVESLGLLASSISQSERLGASLGDLLRLQSEYIRRELTYRAEERAQKAPLAMLLPLTGFIFPATLLILFAPIALRLLAGL